LASIILNWQPNPASSCRDKSETSGIEKGEEPTKKVVNVTQWVKVPSGQSLASRPVEKSTCKPGNGSTELDGTRMQAARLSPEKGIVVEVSGRIFFT